MREAYASYGWNDLKCDPETEDQAFKPQFAPLCFSKLMCELTFKIYHNIYDEGKPMFPIRTVCRTAWEQWPKPFDTLKPCAQHRDVYYRLGHHLAVSLYIHPLLSFLSLTLYNSHHHQAWQIKGD